MFGFLLRVGVSGLEAEVTTEHVMRGHRYLMVFLAAKGSRGQHC